MDPDRGRALQATLGIAPSLEAGDALPPFFHQIHFWDPHPPDRLGRDGHPRLGGTIPDMGLPRRMWAGGRLLFDAPLVAGRPAERHSFREAVARKRGRGGPLGFVTLRHEIWQDGRRVLTEWQDLAYRGNPATKRAPDPPAARTDETVREAARFDTTMLFRYSALTFNGHRIHYDLEYAREIEGYGGLVVHGPLLAQLTILLAERQLGGLRRFAYRLTAPLLHHETAEICWHDEGTVWVRGPDARQCLIGSAS